MGASRSGTRIFFEAASRFTVVSWHAAAAGDPGRLLSGLEARWALRRIFHAGRGQELGDAYRALVSDGRRVADESDDGQMLRALLDGAERGDLRVFEAGRVGSSTFREVDDAKPAPPPRTAKQDDKTWIEFEVIDDATGDGVPDVELLIKLPDAGKAKHTTPGSGTLLFDPCKPGRAEVDSDLAGATVGNTLELCGVSAASMVPLSGTPFPNPKKKPLRVARIHRHRVRSTDTLESIARSANMSWQALAEFNFGTSAPDEVNKALRAQVGCRRKTKDKKSYVFSDADDPGIIYVPRPLDSRALQSGLTHRLCVRPITRPSRLFFFSY